MAQMDLLAHIEQNEETLRGKYLVFSMGSELFGMEIRYITEIIGMQPITEVPEMPEYVKGIINLRGKIIPVMDARLRFKKEARAYDERTCIIVLETNDIFVGLIVDSVAEVLDLPDEDFAPPPQLNHKAHRYLKGVGKTSENVILLLDCQRLLTDEEVQSLSAMA